MKNAFDLLGAREQYGSKRRSKLLTKNLKEGVDLYWMYSFEVDLDGLLKRVVGFDNWKNHWDVGLYYDGDKTYVLLSRANDLGAFEVLEKVEYTEDLRPGTWLSDCIRKHIVR